MNRRVAATVAGLLFPGFVAAECCCKSDREVGRFAAHGVQPHRSYVSRDFTVGQTYTRGEIRQELGGDLSSYLPHRAGRVVCGCFRPDLNPDAPDVILPGRGPEIERWARVFATQHAFIPCFVKADTNAWEYVGRFCVRRVISDAAELRARATAASRPPGGLSMVLYLRGE